MKKLISIVSPCYNEVENVEPLWQAIKKVCDSLPQYDFEHIFIDNFSSDGTREVLKEIAKKDKRVKVILNARNFGHIRSPIYGMLQGKGDAVVILASDFQDPPDLIPAFIKKWEEGYRIAVGVKATASESWLMFAIRKFYYDLVSKISDVKLIKNTTGFGLYDRSVLEIIRKIDDPYPYFRGLISEIGFQSTQIVYHQPLRHRGVTKNNFYTLYDMAMLGITSHSKVPLRLATMAGFAMSGVSLFISLVYLVYKLISWHEFAVGQAPILFGIFFFGSVQLFFIGLLGEYIGSIQTQVMNRPMVVEEERINFDETPPKEDTAH